MDLNQAVVLDYYSKLTQDYDNGNVRPPEVILPPVPEITGCCTTVPSPHQYLLPSVILWDPLQQLNSFKEGIRCPYNAHNHHDDKCFLEPKKSIKGEYWWQAGQRPSMMPRQLSSSSWPTVLLSRIYYCNSKVKHKSYIAHDADILSTIPSSELPLVPFTLLHRTGFTKELCDTVASLVASGMSLEDIEQVIYQQHITNFAHCKAKFQEDEQLCRQNAGCLESEESEVLFPEYKSMGLPSMEMILGSLLDNFEEQQVYYNQRMSELSAEILLMGYFFKVSQQMGAVGTDSKRWVSMYDHIFAVMNEMGQVLAWQVTKGTSMQDVSVLLENLQQRLTRQGATITLILTPECCQQKDLITSIFGSNIKVKMDSQFAYRRLEKRFKIRKGDHDLAITCLQDFNLVFHKSTDLNIECNEETPSPDVILGNLHSFISQWKTVKGETNERLLHDPALRELEAIKTSVPKGCLSNIPPNSGAKHVKVLRNYLKPVLDKRYLTADLAIPALTVLFFYWNENYSGAEAVVTINSYKSLLENATFAPTTEKFGLVENAFCENKENELSDSTALVHDLYSYQCNLFPLLWGMVSEDCYSNRDPVTTTNNPKLSSTFLSKLLSMMENNYLILQNLKSICPENVSPVSIWNYHLLPCCTEIFSKCNSEVQDDSEKTSKLQNIIEMFGGTVINQQDSDDFFTSLCHGLHALLTSLEVEKLLEFKQVQEHLNSIGYKVDELKGEAESTGVTILRYIISTEWQQNKDKYSKLVALSLLDINQEAELLTHQGYCQTEMSNLFPIAAAKVLKLPLIIFTSMDAFPVIPVVSAEQPLTSKCLYMGYSTEGLGSYHPVDITPSQPVVTQDKPKHTCRCGLGSSKNKKERKFCVQVPGMYLTRCECYRSGEACNHLCRCFNCANPRGTSTETKAMQTSQKTRLRTRHKLQQMKLKKPFRIQCESPKTSWSEKECLALEFLLNAMQFSLGIASVSEFTPEMVANEYENLQQACEGKTILKHKSLDEIREHLNIIVSSQERFQTLFRKEAEKHWNQHYNLNLDSVEISDANQLVVIVESSE